MKAYLNHYKRDLSAKVSYKKNYRFEYLMGEDEGLNIRILHLNISLFRRYKTKTFRGMCGKDTLEKHLRLPVFCVLVCIYFSRGIFRFRFGSGLWDLLVYAT